jgi:putative ABC transport system substrate-binding protein
VNELLSLNVHVLLTLGTPVTRAAQQATKKTPIVMVTVADPVQSGFVVSLSHPGGNITGSSEMSEELAPKRIQLLKEAIPKATLVAVLWDPTHPPNAVDLRRTEAAAHALGLKVRAVAARDRAQIEKAFGEIRRWHPNALIVLDSYLAFIHLPRIVDLAKTDKLPTIYGTWQGARAGALFSYGPDVPDQYRNAALFVDTILRGAKPADLPVKQPTQLRLAINLSTAKALDLTIPQALLLRADDVFE